METNSNRDTFKIKPLKTIKDRSTDNLCNLKSCFGVQNKNLVFYRNCKSFESNPKGNIILLYHNLIKMLYVEDKNPFQYSSEVILRTQRVPFSKKTKPKVLN